MSISSTDIAKLREQTGAGILDCKKALEENNGNIEAAVDWLRQKGIRVEPITHDAVEG